MFTFTELNNMSFTCHSFLSNKVLFWQLPTCLVSSVNFLSLPLCFIKSSSVYLVIVCLLGRRLIWKLQPCSFSLSDLFRVKLQLIAFIKREYNFHPTGDHARNHIFTFCSFLVNCENGFLFQKMAFARRGDISALWHVLLHLFVSTAGALVGLDV